MKVMLVEDSRGMRKLLASMLKGMGFTEVIEAEHGGEAWDLLRRQQIDLLLTDWNMPIMDGIELIEKVRRNEDMVDLPILMFTARSAKEDVIRALKAGADTYMAKPFTPQQLRAKVQSIMGRRSLRQVSQILGDQTRLNRASSDPLVIFGEGAADERQLSLPDNREIMLFLARAISSLKTLNSHSEEMRVGYLLENSTTDITKRMRLLRGRIRLMMLSTDLPGGGVTLARLASINRQSGLTVFVVCEMRSEIPTKARYGLEHLGIIIFERHRMDEESLEQLFNEYVIAPIREGVPSELPTPEEIRQRLENDIRSMVSLPVLPQVYHQIVALDRDAESDIQDWIEAIEIDPLSRAQVIRRAHSPIYGFQGEIDETSKAVILLGKNTVKELIVSGAVKRSFEGIEEEGFDIEDYWFHSVAVAIAARLLNFPLNENAWTPEQRRDFEDFALEDEVVETLRKLNLNERLRLKPKQDPFIGGMMHDIGKMALIQAYPGLFPIIIQELEIKSWNVPMRFAEEMVAGGADHALVGRLLGDSWKLGDDLNQVIEFHHNPSSDDNFAQLIALANFFGGGIYPYPKKATFPPVRLLQEEEPVAGEEEGEEKEAAPPASAGEAEKIEERQAGDASDQGPSDPLAAAAQFVPEGVLQRLEISLGDLLGVGRLLAPTVRRLAEDLRKSI